MQPAIRTPTLTREAFAAEFAGQRPSFVCLAAAVLGTRQGAEDVVQEAALTALGKLEQFEPGTNFGAWMGRIVRWTALNHGRARTRHKGPALVAEPAAPTAADALALDFDDRLMRALATLDVTARAALLLRTVLELDYRRISALLEIPEGTAMSHVHRSREALRRALSTPDGGPGRTP